MNEFELIKNYLIKLAKKSKSSLNLNDDIFFNKANKLAVSVDTYVEGNHFINFRNPELVIKKIIRSSISDLICKGVNPKYYFLSASGNKVGKLVEICRKVGADCYLSGPAAKNYIGDEFRENGISLQWMEYGPYPEYDQFGQNFEHAVSIIDLIAHTGLAAADHIW